MGKLFTVLCAVGLSTQVLAYSQPWLDPSLHYEDRLKLFVASLNTTRKIAMTSGDTEVRGPSKHRTKHRTEGRGC